MRALLGDEQNPYALPEEHPADSPELDEGDLHVAFQAGADAQFRAMMEWLDRNMLHRVMALRPLRVDGVLVHEDWRSLKAELEEAPDDKG